MECDRCIKKHILLESGRESRTLEFDKISDEILNVQSTARRARALACSNLSTPTKFLLSAVTADKYICKQV